MAENTEISWCDHTFNPWIGCTKVSPGCDNCYAARQDTFRHWTPEGWGGPRKRTKTWGDPVKWEKQHEAFFAAHGRRQRVFCASLADVFDNQVDPQWRADLFDLIARTPDLDWLLLTKRIGNVRAMLPSNTSNADAEMFAERYPNVWLGATIVNQEEADRDIPKLLATPAAVRFLSMEPLLGPVDIGRYLTGQEDAGTPFDGARTVGGCRSYTPPLDWVIVGGESGPNARPMHPDWARSLRDQCSAAGVPFHFKQWGEWAPNTDPKHASYTLQERIGKKAAGRLLDGVTHDAFPEVR